MARSCMTWKPALSADRVSSAFCRQHPSLAITLLPHPGRYIPLVICIEMLRLAASAALDQNRVNQNKKYSSSRKLILKQDSH